jgi:hypothetical protein
VSYSSLMAIYITQVLPVPEETSPAVGTSDGSPIVSHAMGAHDDGFVAVGTSDDTWTRRTSLMHSQVCACCGDSTSGAFRCLDGTTGRCSNGTPCHGPTGALWERGKDMMTGRPCGDGGFAPTDALDARSNIDMAWTIDFSQRLEPDLGTLWSPVHPNVSSIGAPKNTAERWAAFMSSPRWAHVRVTGEVTGVVTDLQSSIGANITVFSGAEARAGSRAALRLVVKMHVLRFDSVGNTALSSELPFQVRDLSPRAVGSPRGEPLSYVSRGPLVPFSTLCLPVPSSLSAGENATLEILLGTTGLPPLPAVGELLIFSSAARDPALVPRIVSMDECENTVPTRRSSDPASMITLTKNFRDLVSVQHQASESQGIVAEPSTGWLGRYTGKRDSSNFRLGQISFSDNGVIMRLTDFHLCGRTRFNFPGQSMLVRASLNLTDIWIDPAINVRPLRRGCSYKGLEDPRSLPGGALLATMMVPISKRIRPDGKCIPRPILIQPVHAPGNVTTYTMVPLRSPTGRYDAAEKNWVSFEGNLLVYTLFDIRGFTQLISFDENSGTTHLELVVKWAPAHVARSLSLIRSGSNWVGIGTGARLCVTHERFFQKIKARQKRFYASRFVVWNETAGWIRVFQRHVVSPWSEADSYESIEFTTGIRMIPRDPTSLLMSYSVGDCISRIARISLTILTRLRVEFELNATDSLRRPREPIGGDMMSEYDRAGLHDMLMAAPSSGVSEAKQ